MDAKEYLKSWKKYDLMISNKTAELIQCKEAITSITAKWGGERVQGTGNPHRMADAIGKYVDLEREINEQIDCMLRAKKEVIETIETLDAEEYDILHKRYIQKMSFKEIAYSCEISESSATTTHGRALQEVQKIIDERELTEA